MNIISFTNHKGGVGKTNISVNMAVYFSSKGYKVLLVDADCQGNATTYLGVDKWALTCNTFYDFLNGNSNCIYTTKHENLHLIGNNRSLENWNKQKSLEAITYNRDILFTKAIKNLGHYDLIIIDTPPAIDFIVANCLSASDFIFVPIILEPDALQGLESIRYMLNDMNKKVDGIILTMVNKSFRLTKELKKALEKHFDSITLSTSISRSIKVPELLWKKIPIIKTELKVGEEYKLLGKEMEQLIDKRG